MKKTTKGFLFAIIIMTLLAFTVVAVNIDVDETRVALVERLSKFSGKSRPEVMNQILDEEVIRDNETRITSKVKEVWNKCNGIINNENEAEIDTLISNLDAIEAGR